MLSERATSQRTRRILAVLFIIGSLAALLVAPRHSVPTSRHGSPGRPSNPHSKASMSDSDAAAPLTSRSAAPVRHTPTDGRNPLLDLDARTVRLGGSEDPGGSEMGDLPAPADENRGVEAHFSAAADTSQQPAEILAGDESPPPPAAAASTSAPRAALAQQGQKMAEEAAIATSQFGDTPLGAEVSEVWPYKAVSAVSEKQLRSLPRLECNSTKEEGQYLRLVCKPHEVVFSVSWAVYGTPSVGDPKECVGFDTDPRCNVELVRQLEAACVGQRSCELRAGTKAIGQGDPCPGTAKRAAVKFFCHTWLLDLRPTDDPGLYY